jgi:hypothetical protein
MIAGYSQLGRLPSDNVYLGEGIFISKHNYDYVMELISGKTDEMKRIILRELGLKPSLFIITRDAPGSALSGRMNHGIVVSSGSRSVKCTTGDFEGSLDSYLVHRRQFNEQGNRKIET